MGCIVWAALTLLAPPKFLFPYSRPVFGWLSMPVEGAPIPAL